MSREHQHEHELAELLDAICSPIIHSLQRIERTTMATQEEVQQLVDEVTTIKGDLDTAKTNIESEFATLEQELAEGKPANEVDLTPLRTAIGELTPAAEGLETLKANPPAAAPATSTSAPGEPLSQAAIDAAAAAQASSSSSA